MTLFINFVNPAKLIGLCSPLNSGQGIVELLCHRADLTAVYRELVTLICELSDGRNDCGGSAAPGLFEFSALKSVL